VLIEISASVDPAQNSTGPQAVLRDVDNLPDTM